jgi:hypothetical protein
MSAYLLSAGAKARHKLRWISYLDEDIFRNIKIEKDRERYSGEKKKDIYYCIMSGGNINYIQN